MPIGLTRHSLSNHAYTCTLFGTLIALSGCNSQGVAPGATATRSGATCPVTSHPMERFRGPLLKEENDQQQSNAALRALINHVPPKARSFKDLGKLASDRELSVTIALALNNESELDQRISEMYQPGNPNFHNFLTPEEFRSRYSPTPDQVKQVSSFLESKNIQTESVSQNRLFIRAKGTSSALSSVFHTELHHYQSQNGETYFAPAYEFQIPSDIPIQAVHGLQNVTRFKSYARSLAQPQAVAHGGSGPNGGFTPDDIRKAYELPSSPSINGTGQTLALFELDGYSESDVNEYSRHFGLRSVPLKNILVDEASGEPSGNGGENEVTLDIELMIALAPGASQILVYEGPNSEQGMLDTYAKIADDNLAKNISTSWGISEDQSTTSLMQSENNIFKQMAAQGQSIYAAAGDNGAKDNGSSLSVDDPGAQPYVVGVGGTKLTVNSDGSYKDETTWNESASSAGGGGISTIWKLPSWQIGLANAQNLGSSTMRNVPDVALNSDPNTGYAIYSGGKWKVFGGTSCAAPLWAAFTALINQQRQEKGLSVLGFPNPAIYQTARTHRYDSDFHNINDGSTNGHFPATSGYDNATGWGTFIGSQLFEDLISDSSSTIADAPGTSPGSPGACNL